MNLEPSPALLGGSDPSESATTAPLTTTERHPWRERLCRRLNHGIHEVREEQVRGNVLVSALVRRECGQGHLWQRRL